MDVPSPPIFTVSNWIVLLKNSRASKIGFTFYMITLEHMSQSRPAKNDWSLDGLPFLIHLTLQTWLLLTIICFDLSPITCMRKSSMTKVNLVDFFSRRSLDFYERGIFSLSECWRQIVHNDGAYIIEN